MAPLTLSSAQSTLVTQTDTNLDTVYSQGLSNDTSIILQKYGDFDSETKVSVRNPFKSTAAAMFAAMGTRTWTNITLSANWAATDTNTYYAPSYTVTGWNTLKLRGHMKPSAGAATSIGTLPTGARPLKTVTKVIPGSTGVAIFTITAAGAMSVSVVTTSADYSLDGLELDLT